MAGLGGGGRRREPSSSEVKAQEAQERAQERAESQERTEMRGAQARRRLLSRGGFRLLFSPARLEGPGVPRSRKLGGGS